MATADPSDDRATPQPPPPAAVPSGLADATPQVPTPPSGKEGGLGGERTGLFRPKWIIAGFGLPGRSVSEELDHQKIPYTVIEVNPEVVFRCAKGGRHMVLGDVRDPAILESAGIGSVDVVALMMPVEHAVVEAARVIRRLRPDARILARTTYLSVGMEMKELGVTNVVIAEEVVARASAEIVRGILKRGEKPPAIR